MVWMTQNDLKHLTDKSYPIHTEYSAPRSKFQSVLLYMTSRFRDDKIMKNRKWTKWPRKDLNHLTVPCIHWITTPYSHISLFCSTTRHFRDTRLLKIGNAPNDPRMTLTSPLNCQKYPVPVYTEFSPNFTPFRFLSLQILRFLFSSWGTMVNFKNSLRISNSTFQQGRPRLKFPLHHLSRSTS